MRAILDNTFDDYIASSEETLRSLLHEGGDFIGAIRSMSAFFTEKLWAASPGMSAIATMSGMNGYMLLLAGVRTAMTGHVAAVFPLLRTALEGACYAHLMVQNPALEQVWINRQKDQASRRACRDAFTPAVKKASDAIDSMSGFDTGYIFQVYEAAIDFGGHPNVKGVFDHVSIHDPGGEEIHVRLAGLHAADAPQVAQALVACLDFGQALAAVLVAAHSDVTQDMLQGLEELNQMKEQCVADFQRT